MAMGQTGWLDRAVSEVVLVGRAQRISAAPPGISWLLALAPEPGEPWIDAFADHPWDGPLPLQLEPPRIVCVGGKTGVGLRAVHVDGSIVPYASVHASVHAAVERANAIVAGHDVPSLRHRRAEQVVRQMLRQPHLIERQPPKSDPLL